VVDPAIRSTTVATVDLDDAVPAEAIETVLRENGIRDISGYRKLGRNQLRIACFPNIDPDDISRLTGAIDFVVAQG
jgi:phosphoserine aminotransferase